MCDTITTRSDRELKLNYFLAPLPPQNVRVHMVREIRVCNKLCTYGSIKHTERKWSDVDEVFPRPDLSNTKERKGPE